MLADLATIREYCEPACTNLSLILGPIWVVFRPILSTRICFMGLFNGAGCLCYPTAAACLHCPSRSRPTERISRSTTCAQAPGALLHAGADKSANARERPEVRRYRRSELRSEMRALKARTWYQKFGAMSTSAPRDSACAPPPPLAAHRTTPASLPPISHHPRRGA